MDEKLRHYFAQIGRKGGLKSTRVLDPAMARQMVRIREARRAFHRFYSTCFWSFDENYVVGAKDVEWVAKQLLKQGNREAWHIGSRLCR